MEESGSQRHFPSSDVNFVSVRTEVATVGPLLVNLNYTQQVGVPAHVIVAFPPSVRYRRRNMFGGFDVKEARSRVGCQNS